MRKSPPPVSDTHRARLSEASRARWADPAGRASQMARNTPPPKNVTTYTQRQMDLLTALWADTSLSSAEIGRRMGLTKNAVVGKASRMDLAPRPSPIKRLPLPGATPVTASGRVVGARHHSADTRAKISASTMGRVCTPDQRALLSSLRGAIYWPPDRVETLRELWSDMTITVVRIALRIGLGKTTVRRKAGLLGLPPRNAVPLPVRVQRVEIIPLPPSGGTTGEAGCRYPLWEDRAGPVPLFCGKPRVGVGSWCRECRARCFNKSFRLVA